MSYRVLRRDDGRYAVWSSVVEDFVIDDAEEWQVKQWYVGKRVMDALDDVEEMIDSADNETHGWGGMPGSYDEAVEKADSSSL